MKKSWVYLLLAGAMVSGGCSSPALKQTGYNPATLQSIGIMEPMVTIEKIQGRSIVPLVMDSQSASLYLEKTIMTSLGKTFQLSEQEGLSDAAQEAVYGIFARIDTILDRGGLYDSEAHVNGSHKNVELDQLHLDRSLLKPLPKDQPLLLMTFLSGMVRDGVGEQKVVTAADAIAGVSDALEVDNNIITHYAYLAVALVDASDGAVLYYNKNYRHLDPRDENVLRAQLQVVLDPITTAGPAPTSK